MDFFVSVFDGQPIIEPAPWYSYPIIQVSDNKGVSGVMEYRVPLTFGEMEELEKDGKRLVDLPWEFLGRHIESLASGNDDEIFSLTEKFGLLVSPIVFREHDMLLDIARRSRRDEKDNKFNISVKVWKESSKSVIKSASLIKPSPFLPLLPKYFPPGSFADDDGEDPIETEPVFLGMQAITNMMGLAYSVESPVVDHITKVSADVFKKSFILANHLLDNGQNVTGRVVSYDEIREMAKLFVVARRAAELIESSSVSDIEEHAGIRLAMTLLDEFIQACLSQVRLGIDHKIIDKRGNDRTLIYKTPRLGTLTEAAAAKLREAVISKARWRRCQRDRCNVSFPILTNHQKVYCSEGCKNAVMSKRVYDRKAAKKASELVAEANAKRGLK
ncbi:MAG: hypothetical protein LBU61_02430 [Coriobacteriales bacterium]|jgi:hypothetical protein|nr:hypothetical protein [Coriobacteriales bacterium]